MPEYCVQAGYKSWLKLRTKALVKHSPKVYADSRVHKKPTFTPTHEGMSTFFTSTCAQYPKAFQSVFAQVVPTFHTPYNNDNKLNV